MTPEYLADNALDAGTAASSTFGFQQVPDSHSVMMCSTWTTLLCQCYALP